MKVKLEKLKTEEAKKIVEDTKSLIQKVINHITDKTNSI